MLGVPETYGETYRGGGGTTDQGDIGGVPQGVTVNVNNYGSSNVEASSGTGADGKKTIDLTIWDSVRRGAATGQLDSAFKAYGMRRVPVGR